MLPLTSSFCTTSRMSKSAYWLSRTPSAMFSKSQNNARLRSPFTAATSLAAGIILPLSKTAAPTGAALPRRRDRVEGGREILGAGQLRLLHHLGVGGGDKLGDGVVA